MTTPKISKEVSDLLDPGWMKDDNADLGTNVPRLTKSDPAKTEKELDRLLCPDDLRDKPDDPAFKPDPTGLVPDWARDRKSEEEEDELQAKEETPDEKEPAKVSISFEGGITLGEWLERQTKDKAEKAENEKLEREIEGRKVEDENREIKESFRRLAAKKDANDLTPDNLK